MAKYSAIQKLSKATCLVTIEGDGEAVTFEVEYNKRIPPAMFITLMEFVTLGGELTLLGTDFQRAQEYDEPKRTAALNALRGRIRKIKGDLNSLPDLLASVVISQDLEDDNNEKLKPDAAYFRVQSLEVQMAYANAIMEDYQRPTNASAPNSQEPSLQEAKKDLLPSNGDVSEPLNTKVDSPDGKTSMMQTA